MNIIIIVLAHDLLRFDEIKSLLGKAFRAGEDYAIYCADCLPSMKAMSNGLVALTVTSPPYKTGKEYEVRLPLEEYLRWCEQWMAEVYRITQPDGSFWLNIGYVEMPGKGKAIPLPYLLWNRSPFYLLQEVVWNYGAGVAAKKSL
jgi:adenine-specific DNA-methyltransferase